MTQNQLLKSVQVQILSLRFMSIWRNLADARDLGSRAEKRESPSLSMDIDYQPAKAGCFFFAKILKNTMKNTSKNSLLYRNFSILDTEKTKRNLK